MIEFVIPWAVVFEVWVLSIEVLLLMLLGGYLAWWFIEWAFSGRPIPGRLGKRIRNAGII